MTKEKWQTVVLTQAGLLREQMAEESRVRAEIDALEEQIRVMRRRIEELSEQLTAPWNQHAHVSEFLRLVCREEIES